MLARNFYPLAQRNKDIGASGQINLVLSLAIKLFFQFFGHRQRNVFFMNARVTDCARIMTAVPGIDHHHFFEVLGGGRRFGRRFFMMPGARGQTFVAVSVVYTGLLAKLTFRSHGDVNGQSPFKSRLRGQHKHFFDNDRF